ncbi:hypothetical protein BWP39_29925 [Paraburkholderia acidicola]|uniref:Uncharacterized protein n=1 Tax=Paraburkholderia acidicola TaxID=1912599 RepID=A0A2A4EQJ5_9BURK|nr:hypothetical protein BWP39_29925 [Paraburkholderia acidicola]
MLMHKYDHRALYAYTHLNFSLCCHAKTDRIACRAPDFASEYPQFLKKDGLLEQRDHAMTLDQLNNAYDRRIWHSDVKYADRF